MYLLPGKPIFPPLAGFVEKLAGWAIRTGRAKPVSSVCPELTPEWEHPLTMLHNIFGDIEKWQRRYYQFDRVKKYLPNYTMAYKQVVSNYLTHRLYTMLAIKRFGEEIGQKDISVIGVSSDIIKAMEAYGGKENDEAIQSFKVPRFVLNIIITVPILFYSCLWIISRIRLSPAQAKSYAVMVDYIGDTDDIALYPEMTDDESLRLVVRSGHEAAKAIPNQISHFEHGPVSEGILELTQGVSSLFQLLGDGLKLLAFSGKLETALYYQLITMPLKRMIYRALFRRFRPAVFWGRDAYNVEHILRKQELNDVGGQSWCSIHGYPTYTSIFPMFRYISFDRLYAVSRSFYEKHYVDTWSSDITVVGTSTFRASRKEFSTRTPSQDKPADILVMCAIFVREPGMADFVRTLAIAFPERKIYLQIKPGYRDMKMGLKLLEQCTEGLSNVVVSLSSPYELFAKARYVFSDPSTAIMEAIQFGSMSFAIDISAIQTDSPLRDFEEICVTSGEMAVEKINAIENGFRGYPIDTAKLLANISGTCFQDTIRKDLGLAQRELSRPVW